MDGEASPRTGMLLGKFLPPHAGHRFLVEFAREYADALTILLYSRPDDAIPGALRLRWMRELFPDVDVRHVTEDVPWSPDEHRDFWAIWQAHLRRLFPDPPDLVFASEDYGPRLAQVLDAEFVPVDPDRLHVPVRGRDVLADPLAHWEHLPRPVRPHFVRRVCLFGPESTGKTTLARALAARYATVFALEYARTLLDPVGGRCEPEDLARIVRGQIACEEAMARSARRVLFCDTDPLTTAIWSDVLFGDVPAWLDREADRRPYDLYLLLDVDVPWVDDGQRFLRDGREALLGRFREALESRGRAFVHLQGSYDERLRDACAAVDALLGEEGPPRTCGIDPRRTS